MRKFTATLACAAGIAVMATAAAAQQEITLTVAAGQPLRAMKPLGLVSTFFIPEVDRRIKEAGLDIKINWKEAYAGALLKPTFVLQGVSDGIADIGFEPTIFHPDKLPLEQVSFMTPFTTTDVVKVGQTIDKLHATIPAFEAQYAKFGVKRLAGSSFDSYELFTTMPIKTFADMEGKKISTAGAALQWLRGTGAVPVDSNMTLYYNNAKTGVIDGFIIFPSAIPGMKYPEAAPHVTKVGFGAQYAAALLINQGVFDGLPPELQKIMVDAAAAWTAKADAGQQEAYEMAYGNVAKDFPGAETYAFPEEERKNWAMAMPNIAKEWAEKMEGMGLPGNEVLSAYMDTMRESGAEPVRNWDKQ
jgi:TRAP-type C4-dicarboxylate transport system substrate-binding protein